MFLGLWDRHRVRQPHSAYSMGVSTVLRIICCVPRISRLRVLC